MDKTPSRSKTKSKKPTTKKRKSEEKCKGSACSTFLTNIRKRFAAKKPQEEVNVVQNVIESLTKITPIKVSMTSIKPQSVTNQPIIAPKAKIEEKPMRTKSPKLSKDSKEEQRVKSEKHMTPVAEEPLLKKPIPEVEEMDATDEGSIVTSIKHAGVFKVPRMPLINSDVFKQQKIAATETVSVNTENDIATEIFKHVNTLKKISLIAEEFNQKTAKNLREVVDSVQEDLMKKLEETRRESAYQASIQPVAKQ